jgi:hypothetical protein
MKKPAPILITIPEPCTQDWNEMQPVPGGRYCAHCQKAVVDFSRMTIVIFLLVAFAETANGQIKRNKPDELHQLQKPNYSPKPVQYTIDTIRVSLNNIRDSVDAVIQNKSFTEPYSYSGLGVSSDGDGSQRKFIIDGVQLNPSSAIYKSVDSQRTAPMESPGRKTIKGDDLLHSFRMEDLQWIMR